MNNHLSERQKSKQRVSTFYKVKITKIALYYILLHCNTPFLYCTVQYRTVPYRNVPYRTV